MLRAKTRPTVGGGTCWLKLVASPSLVQAVAQPAQEADCGDSPDRLGVNRGHSLKEGDCNPQVLDPSTPGSFGGKDWAWREPSGKRQKST